MAADFSFFIEDIFDFTPDEAKLFLTIYLVAFAFIMLLAFLPQYVLYSIGYTGIARRRGVKGAWLAWIPIARYWVIGGIADEYDRRVLGHKRCFRIILFVSAAVYIVSIFVLTAGFFALIPLIENAIDGNEFGFVTNTMQFLWCFELGYFGVIYSGIILTALYYVAVYKIIESISPKLSLLFFLLSLFVPLFLPIWLVVMRKKIKPEIEELPEAVRIGWYEN